MELNIVIRYPLCYVLIENVLVFKNMESEIKIPT